MRVLGSAVSAQIVRYLASLPADRSWAYWREIDDALEGHASTSIRRQLGQLEDAGVVVVDVPGNAQRGGRRGSSVRYALDRGRLDAVITATHAWLLGGPDPGVRV